MGNKKGQRRAKSERTTERYCWMEREHVPWQRLWVQLELKMQLCRWIWQDYSVWVRRSRPIRPQPSLSLCVCVCVCVHERRFVSHRCTAVSLDRGKPGRWSITSPWICSHDPSQAQCFMTHQAPAAGCDTAAMRPEALNVSLCYMYLFITSVSTNVAAADIKQHCHIICCTSWLKFSSKILSSMIIFTTDYSKKCFLSSKSAYMHKYIHIYQRSR